MTVPPTVNWIIILSGGILVDLLQKTFVQVLPAVPFLLTISRRFVLHVKELISFGSNG